MGTGVAAAHSPAAGHGTAGAAGGGVLVIRAAGNGAAGAAAGSESQGLPEGGTGTQTAATSNCKPATFPAMSTTCHRSEDCMQGWACVGEVTPPPQCGSPCPGCFTDACATDTDCMGGICERSAFTGRTECLPRCSDASCGQDNRCEADGRCAPLPCTEGFACTAGYRCDPSVPATSGHGCVQIPCDEAGAAACPYPTVCVGANPSQPGAQAICTLVSCEDARHPGCERNTRCVPQLSPPPDAVGCTRLSCTRDAECDCGSCLFTRGSSEGLCYDHIGVCELPANGSCPP